MINASPDLFRILRLPERDPPAPDPWDLPANQNVRCSCASMGRVCITRLYGPQRAALEEMREARGLFGMISVGGGKTALGILAACAMELSPAVLLLPPGQVGQTVQEATWIGQHMRVPRVFVVESGARDPVAMPDVPGTDASIELALIPYSVLSRPESTDLLERLAPKIVISDEAHRLRHRSAATTRRVLRYLAAQIDGGQGIVFVCWSGTLTSRSLRDFSHLAAFALQHGSPLPLDPGVVDQWAECFDSGCDAEGQVGAFAEYLQPGEDPREGLRRRMFRTRGVVGSVAEAIESLPSLRFEIVEIPVGLKIRTALKKLDAEWALPDGEELLLAMDHWRAKTELLCGFHYTWIWQPGTSKTDIDEWLEARAEWHRELRGRLLYRSRPGLDSPALVERAMLSGLVPSSERLERWNAVRERVAEPKTVPVWIDDAWLQPVVELARTERALVWYTHDAVGKKLVELGLLAYDQAEGMVADLRAQGAPPAALSIKACGQGVDGLQRLYAAQAVICPFSSGDGWEQLLGRLHRQGQEQLVTTYVIDRDCEYLADAIERARYVRSTMGLQQKLLVAGGLERIGQGQEDAA